MRAVVILTIFVLGVSINSLGSVVAAEPDAAVIECVVANNLTAMNETAMITLFMTNQTEMFKFVGCVWQKQGMINEKHQIVKDKMETQLNKAVKCECMRGAILNASTQCMDMVNAGNLTSYTEVAQRFGLCRLMTFTTALTNMDTLTIMQTKMDKCQKISNYSLETDAYNETKIDIISGCTMKELNFTKEITKDKATTYEIDFSVAKEFMMKTIKLECAKPIMEKAVNECSDMMKDKSYNSTALAAKKLNECLDNKEPSKTAANILMMI